MLKRFFRPIMLSALCLAAWAAAAQDTPKVTLESSEALFSVLAALNHCGYDAAAAAADMRVQVNVELSKAVAGSREAQAAGAEMCAFYREHRQGDAARDFAQYVSLALNLGGPPKFSLRTAESDLPPDASYVLGFVPLLARFALATGLHHLWEEHQYQYEEVAARTHTPITNLLLATDVYLRMPISGYVGRRFLLYLEPMAPPGQVNARNYGADYFLVTAPSGDALPLAQIRHTYLHFILDPLLRKRPKAMEKLVPLLKTVQSAPLDDAYKRDVSLLAVESMIRAVEARMIPGGKQAEPARQREANEAMAQGFILTRYFYEQLVKFEDEPAGLRDALPDWLYNLDVGRESKRAEAVTFAARGAAPEVLASASRPGLLDLAEQRLDAGDYTQAHNLAEKALDQKQEDPGRALFILARAATMNRDMGGAREYFERTVQVARNPRQRAWAHIYLGRIYDLQENRQEALAHYQAALAAGDMTKETRAAAERGLKQPYRPPQEKSR